jgi:hypothetical protein
VSISVLALTAGAWYAPKFLNKFRKLADSLDAELVIAGDGDEGVAMAHRFADVVVRVDLNGATQENAIKPSVDQCKGDWILRFDDDETCSDAMLQWLFKREWEKGQENVFSFPYAWLWDENHFITTAPFWVDPHARLMPKDMTAKWEVRSHAPNPFGTGTIVPVAHCHWKFVVRGYSERNATAQHYDTYFPGAGTGEWYGKFTLPEVYCPVVTLREVGHGDVQLGSWIDTGVKTVLEPKRVE